MDENKKKNETPAERSEDKVRKAVKLLNEVVEANAESNFILIGWNADTDSGFCGVNGKGLDIVDTVANVALEDKTTEAILRKSFEKVALYKLASSLGAK